MKRSKVQIVFRSCPRCGKQVAGTSRSITGADAAHVKYSGICSECITTEELKDIETSQLKAILKRA